MFDVRTLEEGSIVNIVYDTPMLQQETRVVVLGVCGYELARSIDDVVVKQKNVYSTIVSQPEDNLAKYRYLMFKGSDGKPHVAADAWIRNVSVITNLQVRFTVTVDNRDEIDLITKSLSNRGIDDVAYEIIDNTK